MAKSRASQKSVRSGPWLPPLEQQLWNPKTEGKIETPLDSRGLVDLDALVEVGKQTVESDYDWTSPFNDVHHLQWPGSAYKPDEEANEFRELVGRKTFIPRRFHNWLHHITEEPPLPTSEVMKHSIDAEEVAKHISTTVQLAVRLTRKKGLSEAKLEFELERKFEDYTLYVENARLVPVEFQLLKLAEIEAQNIDEMLAVNKQLGKRALHQIPIRMRALRQVA